MIFVQQWKRNTMPSKIKRSVKWFFSQGIGGLISSLFVGLVGSLSWFVPTLRNNFWNPIWRLLTTKTIIFPREYSPVHLILIVVIFLSVVWLALHLLKRWQSPYIFYKAFGYNWLVNRHTGEIVDSEVYCPECQTQLTNVDGEYYRCLHCKGKFDTNYFPMEGLRKNVEKLTKRKARGKLWQKEGKD
jgi:hypothetical protein